MLWSFTFPGITSVKIVSLSDTKRRDDYHNENTRVKHTVFAKSYLCKLKKARAVPSHMFWRAILKNILQQDLVYIW